MRERIRRLVERVRASIVLRRFDRAWKRLSEVNERVSEEELMENIEAAREKSDSQRR